MPDVPSSQHQDRPEPDGEPHTPPPALAADDAVAIDLLIEHGLDLDAATRARPELSARLSAAAALFGRLEAYPVEAPDAQLVDATVARIARAESEREDRMRLQPALEPAQSTPALARWRDLVGLFAAAIIILSIGMPIAAWMQGRSNDANCSNNLRLLGSGIATYFGDHASMPVAASLVPDLGSLANWQDYRGGRHLKHLAESGYCDRSCTCCGADSTGEGYAYQVPSREARLAWGGVVRIPAVADRNPLIDLTRRGRVIGSYSINSPEHGGRGQNVLFTDGSVLFEGSPILVLPDLAPEGHPFATPAHQRLENIWLPLDRLDADHIEDDLPKPSLWMGIDIFLVQ